MDDQEQSQETFQVVAQRCGCRSWFCDRCAVRMGLIVRTAIELYMAATGWVPFAVTLSVNPAWFQSPEDAYEFCRRFFGKYVEELRRRDGRGRCSVGGGGVRLHSGSYVCFFEPHKSGWPHWHLLLDATFVDIEVLRRVWDSFGRRHGKGGIGHVFFTDQKADWTQAMAVSYITKYLTKRPEGGWPDWVMQSRKKLRRLWASQDVNLGRKKRPSAPKPEAHDEICFCRACRGEQNKKCREPSGQCHAERVSRCGSKTALFVVGTSERPDGELVERRRYIGTANDSVEVIASIFGIWSDGQSLVELGNVPMADVRRVCDERQVKEYRRQEAWRARARERLPKRQQVLVDMRPDSGVEALAL
jgi:hypothetical protein